jgi:hypothetical protein
MKKLLFLLTLLAPVPVWAQISIPNTFNPGDTIYSSQVNANFTALGSDSLNRTGGTITGNITVSNGITIDGIDLSAYLDQSVKVAATPTFAGLTISGTGASSLDIGGGLNAGTGNVAIISATGKIPAYSSTYFTSTKLTNYSETKAAPSISSNTLTLDLSTASHFVVALNANITTLTISNAPTSGDAGSFVLVFTADGSARTVTWPASVKWPAGVAPTLTSTNNKKDFFTFVTYDAGTTWYGFVGGQNF